MKVPKDIYGRSFKTLRVSLTATCNLGCVYCVHGEGKSSEKEVVTSELLPFSSLVEIIQSIHALTPLETVRLTGGEPTLYKELIPLVAAIKALRIPSIKMTSNGLLLKNKLEALAKAGLNEVNISLDAIEEGVFKRMSNSMHLNAVLNAVEEAKAVGIKVKLNSVVVRGLNDSQIVPLFDYSKRMEVSIRYLELMKMGPLYNANTYEDSFFPEKEILSILGKQHRLSPIERVPSATANYWETEDGYRFGIISNESAPFCSDCNRLRLDSYGNIYGCLSTNHPISIVKDYENKERLANQLSKALADKQTTKFTGSTLTMISIGG